MMETGVLLAIVAMVCWGFGDFLIQKSTRKTGDWNTLFVITAFGAVALLPFVYGDIPALLSGSNLWVLTGASFVLFVAALLDFEALKEGKLAVVEPIWVLEIPVSGLLAVLIIGESISAEQIGLIACLIVGLMLVSLKSTKISRKLLLERGVFISVIAAVAMGAANFFVGMGSRATGALMVNWFLNVFLAAFSLIFLVAKGGVKDMARNYKVEKKVWLGMCIFDNLAWIAFAGAMSLSPIAITVALSENYIILAALLGMYLNKERMRGHQKLGVALAIGAGTLLALTLA